MPWVDLESVTVGENWSDNILPVIGSELIRLTHRTIADSFNVCYFTRDYPGTLGGFYVPLRVVYSDPSPQILEVPFPRQVRDNPNIQAWVPRFRWRRPYVATPWIIDIDYWQP